MPYRDKETHRLYQRNYLRRKRENFFQNAKCSKCDSKKHLELDHIDRTTKIDHRIWGWSAKRIQEEIKKCQILCHACHLQKSLTERGFAVKKHGWRYNKGCRCRICTNHHRIHANKYKLERKRIELSSDPCHGPVLPLNYRPKN